MNPVLDLELLKRARGIRTLNSVANELGVTRQQIWNYENGKCQPSVTMLVKLADLYGVRVDKLLAEKSLPQS